MIEENLAGKKERERDYRLFSLSRALVSCLDGPASEKNVLFGTRVYGCISAFRRSRREVSTRFFRIEGVFARRSEVVVANSGREIERGGGRCARGRGGIVGLAKASSPHACTAFQDNGGRVSCVFVCVCVCILRKRRVGCFFFCRDLRRFNVSFVSSSRVLSFVFSVTNRLLRSSRLYIQYI